MSCFVRFITRQLPKHPEVTSTTGSRNYSACVCRSTEFVQSIGVWALCCLLVVPLAVCNAYGDSLETSYAKAVFRLVKAHQDGLPRLIAPANATANALIAGGAFYLAGDKGWIAEGDGRAGGLMMVRPMSASAPEPTPGSKTQAAVPAPGTWLPASTRPAKGDVVWIAYSPADYAEDAKTAKELEDRGCLVVLFGPKLEDGPARTSNWIDSLTSLSDDAAFTRMGNIISLWTLTAEVTASASRQGKTLAFYESDSVEGALVRNALYAGLAFHNGFPMMAPAPPGLLSKEYLDYVQTMLHKIQESEQAKITQVGLEMSRRAAEGHPAVLMLVGHMLPYAVDHQSKFFHYLSFPAERKAVQSQLPPDGYFVFIGYVGVYLDLWEQVRLTGARAVWVASPLPTAVNFGQWRDIVVDEHWQIGDCAVEVPGYDVRILPPSGIAQLFIYEMLIRAAGAHSG
jgi:hypothetical protein